MILTVNGISQLLCQLQDVIMVCGTCDRTADVNKVVDWPSRDPGQILGAGLVTDSCERLEQNIWQRYSSGNAVIIYHAKDSLEWSQSLLTYSVSLHQNIYLSNAAS
jgi:hypothetical protein